MNKQSRVSSSLKRVHAVFGGFVQGVGFRFTTIDIARSYAVAGFVRNTEDGAVEVVAEGDEETLKGFVEAIQLSPLRRYINSAQITYGVPRGEFKGFDIRY